MNNEYDDKLRFLEANINDLDLLVKMRLAFLVELRPCDNKEKVEDTQTKTRQYLKDAINNNDYIGFVGKKGDRPVCCAGLLIYKLPPLINSENRVQGHVLNVFTYPEYRQTGYGRGIMEFVIQRAKEKNINRLFLNATEIGQKLYRELGFEPEDSAMALNI